MSSTIGNEWNQLYSNNPKIQAFAVVKEGAIIWQTENWDLVDDSKGIMKAVLSEKSKISIGGVKYNRVSTSDDSYIATADNNQGHILVVMIDENVWAIAFAIHTAVPELSVIDVQKTAVELKGHV
ncbi:MAG: hypothetical protein ACXAAO_01710 [Candidatus Thorarchaeota archaeon]